MCQHHPFPSTVAYRTVYGAEETYTGLAANNFGFIPAGLVLTGGSSWTGFFNDDFTGNSTCYSAPTSDIIFSVNLVGTVIKSLVQGCT